MSNVCSCVLKAATFAHLLTCSLPMPGWISQYAFTALFQGRIWPIIVGLEEESFAAAAAWHSLTDECAMAHGYAKFENGQMWLWAA